MTTDTILDPEELFAHLTAGAKSLRTERSLNIIHQICMEQQARGSNDFSYGTIGKLSKDRGGPAAQPIRNAGGAVYRALINAWANFANGTTRKPQISRTRTLADDVLAIISDPVVRVLVENYIAENKKLKLENQVLKVAAREKVIIDLSGSALRTAKPTETMNPGRFLLDQEKEALRKAISQDNLRKHGWTFNECTGSINKGPLAVFSPGFVTAIKKVLDER